MIHKASEFTILTLVTVAFGLHVATVSAQPQLIFEEDFSDPLLPAWHDARDARAQLSAAVGPHGVPAVSMDLRDGSSRMLTVRLPVEQIAGKAVLLDVWRKAEGVKTGTEHYYNAKTMLSWKTRGVTKPQYSGTQFSDFSGSFDWQRHRYVITMPTEIEWATVSIGMQACTGKASWSKLSIRVDPRFPDQASLERLRLEEQREAFSSLSRRKSACK